MSVILQLHSEYEKGTDEYFRLKEIERTSKDESELLSIKFKLYRQSIINQTLENLLPTNDSNHRLQAVLQNADNKVRSRSEVRH